MNVGFVGLGKLGLPCALAIEAFGGHSLFGADSDPALLQSIRDRSRGQPEPEVDSLLTASRISLGPVGHVVGNSDLVFVAVQTPHAPEFEGITRLPSERVDFDYSYLRNAVSEIAAAADDLGRETLVVVVSTVLPGTMRREILPELGKHCRLCYNPFFIAMGTVVRDFLNPEFVLVGGDNPVDLEAISRFYGTIHAAPIRRMSIESAELTKVAYNTFIGLKLAFMGCMMEVADGVGADVDEVLGALRCATDRVISARYLAPGMGDGGPCHPRDNIAMSYLSRELYLEHDLFESLMLSREAHTSWLAGFARALSDETGLPVVVLGRSYKPDTGLTAGSPALLLIRLLIEMGVRTSSVDPHVDGAPVRLADPAVYFLATPHREFIEAAIPIGSVLIDPWGVMAEQEGVCLIRPGAQATHRPAATIKQGRVRVPGKENIGRGSGRMRVL